MFKIFFLLKCRVRLKEVLWGVLWGISPSKGVLWGRAMAAVQRSIDRTPSLCYGPTAGGRVAGACHASLL
jgi:hypothetical protein